MTGTHLPPIEPDALGWYEAGVTHGVALGRAQVEEELAAAWAPIREHVSRLAGTSPYADLCEKRGEPARAARARETSRRNGVTS